MMEIDITSVFNYLVHLNPWYGVAAAAVIYAVKSGLIALPSIPGIFVKEDALSARVKAKAAAKYADLVKGGKDADEAHAAIVQAIKAVT